MFFFFNPKFFDPGWQINDQYLDALKKKERKFAETGQEIDSEVENYQKVVEEIKNLNEKAFNADIQERYQALQVERVRIAREIIQLEEMEGVLMILLLDEMSNSSEN